jgi:hypothetical protein
VPGGKRHRHQQPVHLDRVGDSLEQGRVSIDARAGAFECPPAGVRLLRRGDDGGSDVFDKGGLQPGFTPAEQRVDGKAAQQIDDRGIETRRSRRT